MELRILGPLEAVVDGVPLPLGGPRRRALLAILLLEANRVVSRDRLIDELWGGEPPEAARHALNVSVARLRKTLSVAGEEPRLLTRPPGYVLRVEPGELDLERFEALLDDGRRAAAAGDMDEAAVRFRRAEGLWRGRPLADLEFEPFARVEVERLEELRLGAIEERIEAELTLGRHEAVVPELEALVGEHTMRERMRGQLMLALYRAGRQADALAVYRDGRRRLVDQHGLDPSPTLRRLEQAILRQDAALEPVAGGVATADREREPPGPSPRPPPVPPAGPRPSRGLRRRLVPVAAIAAVAVVAAVLALDDDAGPARSIGGNALVELAPGEARVTGSAPLAAAPTRVAAGLGSLWATQFDAGTVVRVDPRTRAVRQTIHAGSGPTGVVVAGGAVWVANALDGTVVRIDPGTEQVVQRVAVPSRPGELVAEDGRVWVASTGAGSVSRLDAHTGRVTATIHLRSPPTALAVAAGALWVSSEAGNVVARIDPRRAAVEATVSVGGGPAAMAAGAGALWVANSLDGTVARIDPQRVSVAATIPVGEAPAAIAATPRAVWVAREFAGTVARIDPRTDRVTAGVPAGSETGALVAAGGAVWAATRARGPAHRGGRLVLLNPNKRFDSIDPALATELFPTALLGMTNDGLVTFRHVSGTEGADVVPDLAVAVPSPTDGGRSYTFTLRPGLRYSTGEPVRAGDVRRALERVFALRSPGAVFYDAIVGAPACRRRPAHCDLGRGVLTDEARRTITIRLRAPDPELLDELALPFAFLVGPDAPTDAPATRPLPGTGPYVVAAYRGGHELRLGRNPRFREWSRAAQPDGYPDEIVWRLGVPRDAAVDEILRGRADWMLGFGAVPPGRHRELETRYAAQLHQHATLTTDYFTFNVRTPPFDDVRARRAVELAIDRRAFARLYGGPQGARPTCQVLPPQMPGYRRHCPYPHDVARARRLVAASGTRGSRVVVLDSSAPGVFLDEGRLVVRALRRIGYRPRLVLVPDDVFGRVAAHDRELHADLRSGGWAADYPAASDFMVLKLSCLSYRPNSDGNANAGGFCRPRLDRLMQRARRLQHTDPRTANALWARIDAAVTDDAAWLPLVTPTNTDLVSRRVGNYRYHPLWGALLDQLWVR